MLNLDFNLIRLVTIVAYVWQRLPQESSFWYKPVETSMASLISSIQPRDGFHPVLSTKISLDNYKLLSTSNCSLHLLITLPPLVFVDPYELAHHEEFFTFRHWGTSNLELPVSVVAQNSSSLLLDIKILKNVPEVEVNVPLHLRYGDLTKGSSGHHSVELSWPTGFLSCPLNSGERYPFSTGLGSSLITSHYLSTKGYQTGFQARLGHKCESKSPRCSIHQQ